MRGGRHESSDVECRNAFEILFGLLRHVDECLDDIIFFADEGGSWQVGVEWRSVLPAYFRCLAVTALPEDYARAAVLVIEEFESFNRALHLKSAREAANPAQKRALRSVK